jgi:hypothetical protein
MSGLVHKGYRYLAGFDHGLKVSRDGNPVRLTHSSNPRDNYLNQLAEFNGDVWIATEGGLFKAQQDETSVTTQRILPGSVYAVAGHEGRLAAATSRGLIIIHASGETETLGLQAGIGEPRFSTLAWQNDILYAGGLDGLYRFDGKEAHRISSSQGLTAGWVTALLAEDDRLLIGTYDKGVFAMKTNRVVPVVGAEHQWVPPHAIQRMGENVLVGGLGMLPLQISPKGVVKPIALPVRDVNGFLFENSNINFLTSDGVYRSKGKKTNSYALNKRSTSHARVQP